MILSRCQLSGFHQHSSDMFVTLFGKRCADHLVSGALLISAEPTVTDGLSDRPEARHIPHLQRPSQRRDRSYSRNRSLPAARVASRVRQDPSLRSTRQPQLPPRTHAVPALPEQRRRATNRVVDDTTDCRSPPPLSPLSPRHSVYRRSCLGSLDRRLCDGSPADELFVKLMTKKLARTRCLTTTNNQSVCAVLFAFFVLMMGNQGTQTRLFLLLHLCQLAHSAMLATYAGVIPSRPSKHHSKPIAPRRG